ncbi:MAG: ATP-binding protein [Candidatus Woesearchaeota archaeon]
MKNALVSGKVNEKIKWYIRAHGHSSIGGLNLLWTFFSFNKKTETADIIKCAISMFENFAGSENIDNEIIDLNACIQKIENSIKKDQLSPEKKEEMLNVLSGVKKNITLIKKIAQNPSYEEYFKISKIVYATVSQLLRRHPNKLYGDAVGNSPEKGDHIKMNYTEPANERSILCCGYEIQLMLFNLLSNAVDEIAGKGNIWIEHQIDDSSLLIKISDDGDPLSRQDIKKILANKNFTTKGKNHGHGLKIIHDVVNKYKGKMDAVNKDGIVSFVISIPVKDRMK